MIFMSNSEPNQEPELLPEENVEMEEKVEKDENLFSYTECNISQHDFSGSHTTINEKEDDLDTLVEKLLNGEDPDIIEDEMVPSCIMQLQQIRDEKLYSHEIDVAKRADICVCSLQQRYTKIVKTQAQQNRERSYQERLEIAEKDYKKLQQRIDRARSYIQNRHKTQLEKLKQTHAQDVDDLYQRWQSPVQTRKYSHCSTKLKTLRAQSIRLMSMRNYDDLAYNDKVIAQLEEQESLEQAREMQIEFENQYKLLLVKQKNEVEALEMAYYMRESSLNKDADFELETAKKRIKALERSIEESKDPEKVWSLYHRNDKQPQSRASTPVRIRRRPPTTKALNSLQLPPLTDPRCQSKGKTRRAQTPLRPRSK